MQTYDVDNLIATHFMLYKEWQNGVVKGLLARRLKVYYNVTMHAKECRMFQLPLSTGCATYCL